MEWEVREGVCNQPINITYKISETQAMPIEISLQTT